MQLWLVTNKPSKVDREAGVGWITVKLGSVGEIKGSRKIINEFTQVLC